MVHRIYDLPEKNRQKIASLQKLEQSFFGGAKWHKHLIRKVNNEKAPHKALKMLSPREFLRNKKLAS